MSMKPAVSLYHDTRRVLDNGKFPVRVRVNFTISTGKQLQKYYSTGYSLSRDEWEQVLKGSVRGDLRTTRARILEKEKDANDIIQDIPFISPETFDAIFSGKRTRSALLKPLFNEVIARMYDNDQVSSAEAYKNALDSITEYAGEGVTLNVIDVDFLKGFESWMKKGTSERDPRSVSTVGIYLRNLRAIFNIAIERKIIQADLYPFGRKKYIIPTSKNIKKALSEVEKDKLVHHKPKDLREVRALALWKFSYYCNGMNFADMAYLKRKDIRDDVMIYTRRKSSTTERELTPQIVTLRPELVKYLKNLEHKNEYVFGVLDDSFTRADAKKKIKQWIKDTNKFLGRICKNIGIGKVTTYTARHTAATMLLRAGANTTYIKTALGHSSVTVTENYLSSLDLEEQRVMTSKL